MYEYVMYLLTDDAQTPLRKYVNLKNYVDANILHEQITNRSVMGILNFSNKTPVDWYDKK